MNSSSDPIGGSKVLSICSASLEDGPMCRREKVSKGLSTELLCNVGVVPLVLPVVALV